MTKYLHDVPFSSRAATNEYRANWDAIFARKAEPTEADPHPFKAWPEKPCPCESGKSFAECHGDVPADE